MAIPRASFASLFLVLLFVSPLCCMAKDVIYSGKSLKSGEYLAAGDFRFIMQEDCDLVLYHHAIPLWSSGTSGQGNNCYLSFNKDASLSIYDENNNSLFEITTGLEKGNYVLILHETGRVLIFGPKLWATDAPQGVFGTLFFNNGKQLVTSSSGALPANKAAEEAKATRISMVINK